MDRRLDLRAIEARTRTIGRELFDAARRQHAHLSVLNRWTAQVLSWCLSDAQVRAAVLRFIDVLPSLTTPREIARHIRDYFPSEARLPPALRLGSELARPGVLTQGALAAIVRRLVEQIARQFIAEHQPEGVARAVQALASRRAGCSLDVLGEQVLTEAEADQYASKCQALLEVSAFLSVKPSALTPRFDPISPAQSIERAARRLLPLLHKTSAREGMIPPPGSGGGMITLDMEQYELRDLTLALAKHLRIHPDVASRERLGIVIQAYLRDAEPVVDELLAWLAAHQRSFSVRLVKGAYWDSEVAQACQRRQPIPVYEDKADTDRAFERLTRRLLAAAPTVTTAIASHNVRSVAHAMAVAEALGLPKERLEFQLLYGMGESLQEAIVSFGYPVRVYTPVGELIPGMAYLVRRILENTANESFLRQDFFQERSAEALLSEPVASSAPPVTRDDDAGTGEPWTDWSKAASQGAMREALRAVTRHMGRTYPLLLGDRPVQTNEMLTVRNPAAPSEIVGRVARASAAHADRAVRIAGEAQPRWAATPARERVECVRLAARLMRARRMELAAWEVVEVGKTWREADADVVEAIEHLAYYSRQMLELADGKPLLQAPGERNTYTYQPRGVAAVIAPWNFPSAILAGMASAALVSGNAVILKPAEQSPVIAAHLARIFHEAGVPSGILQYLPGFEDEAGAALAHHPGVHAILFTGSRAVGQSMLEACATVPEGQRFVKHVVAELGGKNAIIVDADADLDAAVEGTLRSAFGYGGQKCSAASRVILHEAIADRFLSRLSAATDRLVLGDPADPDTDVGPLIDENAQRRLLAAIARLERAGTIAYRYPAARVPTAGWFVGPVIAADVPADDPLAREELFGPLLCSFQVGTFEAALALANDTDYALTGGVYSRSPSHLARAVAAFDVGNLYLNRPITGAAVGRQPFGGHRLSGLGTKAGGPDYLLQLLLPKTVCANTARHGIPL